MSDLISRQDVLAGIRAAISHEPSWNHGGLRIAKGIVESLPSAQPEITECKDCENWYTEEDEDDEYGYCRNHDFWTFDIWFCADGERREDERT